MAGSLGVNAGAMAEAVLRTSGGFTVVLRLPGLAVSGSDAEQLGLGSPMFQDVPIGPAVWRKVGVDTELVVSGAAVAALIASQGAASAEALFAWVAGVVVEGLLYTISKSEAMTAGGVDAAYRLSLVAPVRV